jgi:hypothetical protein
MIFGVNLPTFGYIPPKVNGRYSGAEKAMFASQDDLSRAYETLLHTDDSFAEVRDAALS